MNPSIDFQSPQPVTPDQPKKPYETPTLTQHGSVEQLTQQVNIGSGTPI